MSNTIKSPATIRPLHTWEILEARLVFGEGLNYEKIRVHECTPWPDWINRLGTFLKRLPPPDQHNAVTLGNHLYFPVKLLENPVEPNHPESYKTDWLIHELTHAWQFQLLGWRYLWMALGAQFRHGENAYKFGGEEGLVEGKQKGLQLASFNLEQQGDIARTYYVRLKKGIDVTAWQPYIHELQQKRE